MEKLQAGNIKKGKQFLLSSLLSLVVLRLILAGLMYGLSGEVVAFDQFDELYWWQIPLILLMGSGTYQGSTPVRWIFSGALIVTAILEIYLMSSVGFPTTLFAIVSLAEWLTRAVVIYLVMIDTKVEEFLLYQRSKNYGEWMQVEKDQEEDSGESESSRKSKKPNGKTALEDDLEEEENTIEEIKGKKKKKADWEDELGIFD